MEIPLFPLSSVLFPGGRIALRIFEQRYLELVRSSLKQERGFGLVWIAEGAEVASPGIEAPQLAEYGCYARIVDWDSLPDGLLGITIEGGERFRVQKTRIEANQLVMGEVEMEAPRAAVPMVEEWDSMLDVLTNLERHPHVQRVGIKVDHSDAWQVGCVLAQLLPVDEEIKYRLLCLDDPAQFMQDLDTVLDDLGGLMA
jgi:Lon protease-like protein